MAFSIIWGASCSSQPSDSPASDSKEATSDFDDQYNSQEERDYARVAARFAAVLMTGDYQTAYEMGSTHLHEGMSQTEFESAEKEAQKVFGAPLGGVPYPRVNTNPEDLAGTSDSTAGHTMLESRLQNMSSFRAIGELPETVPVEIRKASVQVDIERDVKTIPNFTEQTGLHVEDLKEEDQVISYLTVVLVEEDQELKVAHFFHRWPDIWDQDAPASPADQSVQ